MKIRKVDKKDPNEPGADYVFMCPGCGHGHGVWTNQANSRGAVWSFNGNFDKPTITPSIRVLGPGDASSCHVVVTDGVLNYCADCTHALAGKSVPMEDF